MTLRSRFTLAVAGAVAAVALAITAVAFLVVRSDLTSQLQHELRQQAAAVQRLARHYHGQIPAGWVPPHSDRFGGPGAYAQVVTAGGAVWAPPGEAGLLPGSAAAAQVASGQRGSYYTETTLDGVRAMVLSTPLAPGLAVQLAVPLNVVDQELGTIGATLALLSAAGVGLAALVGWGVARAGLAPVGRLAAVAEQVTATGDPSRRVEVDRADELGRLAASFNTMLGALQRSLAAQRQLVSDAGHELRTPLTSLRINAELLAAEPGLPAASARRCSTGWWPRSPSSASWSPTSRFSPGETSRARPVRPRRTWPGWTWPGWTLPGWTLPGWWPPRWMAPGGTGRRPSSRRTSSRAWSPGTPSG